jgi:hypothetical protein
LRDPHVEDFVAAGEVRALADPYPDMRMGAVESEANRRWRRGLRTWAASIGITDLGEARALTGGTLWDRSGRDVRLALALTGQGSGAGEG